MTLQIREALPTDLPDIVAIYNQSIANKQATADLMPVSVASRQAWFDAHSTAAKRPLLVAIDKAMSNHQGNTPILGWASFSDLYALPAYHISCEISVYIDSTSQRGGVASALIKALLDQAPSLDVHNVVAKIFAHNTPSLRLFTKFGFEEWGVLKQVCDMEGFIADVVILGKSLPKPMVH